MRILALTTFMALFTAPAAYGGPLQEAYDAGYLAGIGTPQLVWGTAMGVGGAAAFAPSRGDAPTGGLEDLGDAIGRVVGLTTTVLGVAQLVPGAVLVGLGHSEKPDDSLVAIRAYDAGYDVGVGGTLIGYGAATGTLSIIMGASMAGEPHQDGAWVPAVAGSLAALQLGLGIWRLIEGLEARDRLRELGMADGPEVAPMDVWRDP